MNPKLSRTCRKERPEENGFQIFIRNKNPHSREKLKSSPVKQIPKNRLFWQILIIGSGRRALEHLNCRSNLLDLKNPMGIFNIYSKYNWSNSIKDRLTNHRIMIICGNMDSRKL